MDKEKTLPQALGLTQEWYDSIAKRVEDNYGKSTTKISDFMEVEANEVKEDEFGDVDINLSRYEKKLVLLGYLIGLQRVKGVDPLEVILSQIMKKQKGDE
jgi:hypothetical protein